MRCLACDAALSEGMAVAKMPVCREYWDLCRTCMRHAREMYGQRYSSALVSNKATPDELAEIADRFLTQYGYDRWGSDMYGDPDG